MEFGFFKYFYIFADEISPDSCRLWDIKTKRSFDKDIFRENKGNLLKSYLEVLKRLKIEVKMLKLEVLVTLKKDVPRSTGKSHRNCSKKY